MSGQRDKNDSSKMCSMQKENFQISKDWKRPPMALLEGPNNRGL